MPLQSCTRLGAGWIAGPAQGCVPGEGIAQAAVKGELPEIPFNGVPAAGKLGGNQMNRLFTRLLSAAAVVGLTAVAPVAPASAEDINIIVVSHGQASDPFWSVVKNGVAQAGTDSQSFQATW